MCCVRDFMYDPLSCVLTAHTHKHTHLLHPSTLSYCPRITRYFAFGQTRNANLRHTSHTFQWSQSDIILYNNWQSLPILPRMRYSSFSSCLDKTHAHTEREKEREKRRYGRWHESVVKIKIFQCTRFVYVNSFAVALFLTQSGLASNAEGISNQSTVRVFDAEASKNKYVYFKFCECGRKTTAEQENWIGWFIH